MNTHGDDARASKLLELFQSAVDSVVGDVAVAKALQVKPLESTDELYLLAVGKAADAMVRGASRVLPSPPIRGLMITKHDHVSDEVSAFDWMQVIEASHPVPDESSLLAGATCIDFVKKIPANAQLLVLMSGGTSALMEHLIDGLTLSDVQQLNEALIAGGLPIDAMNRVRKTVSAIKGGKLSSYIPADVTVTQLVISDVPGDSLTDIGSGVLALPASDAFVHPGELIDRLPLRLPDNLVACINAFGKCPPAASSSVWQRIGSTIVGSSNIAQKAAETAAKSGKTPVLQATGSLHGDVDDIAELIVQTILRDTRGGVYIWGGETHLVLPKKPGRGGRNQHLALAIAKQIAGQSGLSVLCCGTDGSDGPTVNAGGLVTGETIAKGEALGLEVDKHLQNADAGSYLAAVGALVTTGPTGTNVMDLAIALRDY